MARYASILLALASAAPALAQADAPERPAAPVNPTQTNATQSGGWYRWDDGQPKLWNLQAEAQFWYVAPSGDMTLPGTTSNGEEASFEDLNLDSTDGALMVEVHVRRDRWRLSGNVYSLSAEGASTINQSVFTFGDAVAFGGERVNTSVELTSWELTGSYRFFERAQSRSFDGVYKSVSAVDAVVGVRFYDIDVDFSVDLSTRTSIFLTPTDAEAAQLYAHPIVGLRWEWEVYEQVDVNVQSTIGGWTWEDSTSTSWDIMVGLSWRPVPNFGAQIGYRNQFFKFEDGQSPGSFEWTGGVAGLYAGAIVRF